MHQLRLQQDGALLPAERRLTGHSAQAKLPRERLRPLPSIACARPLRSRRACAQAPWRTENGKRFFEKNGRFCRPTTAREELVLGRVLTRRVCAAQSQRWHRRRRPATVIFRARPGNRQRRACFSRRLVTGQDLTLALAPRGQGSHSARSSARRAASLPTSIRSARAARWSRAAATPA